MRAALRLGVAFLVTGLALGPMPALAQDADSATNTPATDSIGPRELQGFSLDGTVTRTADPPASNATPPARPSATPRTSAERPTGSPAATQQPAAERRVEARAAAETPPSPAPTRVAQATTAPQRSSITVDLPPAGGALTPASVPGSPGFAGDDSAAALAPPEGGFGLWPWLLAAMALGAGGAFLFWRRTHHRESLAGGPQIDAFVAPQPPARASKPGPARARQPEATPVPPSTGLVSTRLRPWIDLTFEPLRCIVEDERVVFEFELAMVNSGSAPARDVLIEASTFNAGPTQDQEIDAFFANPVGEGERIAAIPPLKTFNLRTQVAVGRDQIRVLEAGGRHVFVPLMAFNAVYRWGAGEGQTSQAFLLGRDTKGDKMAPFRIDLGARVFRGVGKRALPAAVRR